MEDQTNDEVIENIHHSENQVTFQYKNGLQILYGRTNGDNIIVFDKPFKRSIITKDVYPACCGACGFGYASQGIEVAFKIYTPESNMKQLRFTTHNYSQLYVCVIGWWK